MQSGREEESKSSRSERMGELGRWYYAHRGLHSLPDAPENSLEAFCRAVAHGYGMELDVHLLRDGTLAVLHDSTLKRMTGREGVVEDLTAADLSACRLKKSDQTIPTFRQVLDAVGGRTPLIVELKPWNGNEEALTKAACEMLDGYDGLYCIESFQPKVVRYLYENRPAIIRGLLSMDYLKTPGTLTLPERLAGTLLLPGFWCHPDFIAYRFQDRQQIANRFFLGRMHKQGVAWTLRTPEEFAAAVAEGYWPIFERFLPPHEQEIG